MSIVRLFTLPGAGSSAIMYYKWIPIIGKQIRLSPLEIPGRRIKEREKKAVSRRNLIDLLFEDVKLKLKNDEEYMILGNSASSIIAIDLCRLIETYEFKRPKHIFIAVEPPPDILKNRKKMLEDPKKKNFVKSVFEKYFLDDLITKEELNELLSVFLNIVYNNREKILDFSAEDMYKEIYGDIKMIKGKKYKALEFALEHIKLFIEDEKITSEDEISLLPINVDLTVFGATNDEVASELELMKWKEYTCAKFELYMVEGDHLILFNNNETVLQKIQEKTETILKKI
ncbi:bact protein [Clostridium botulinum]|uniref:thioesterase II family protein n=1 Tax=Clostridium botulinum TaxID=1491 RepID=UPI000C764546|nr:thioesterase domain-containing protein [Clostridium botulinum]AUN22479.1 bact protein [Clostridium botulinum]QDY22000.1 bact protein [Clostridium botulinum]